MASVMPSQYTFSNYSPGWPAEFKLEAERLKALLGAELICVQHKGLEQPELQDERLMTCHLAYAGAKA
jgi:hypothetical protein